MAITILWQSRELFNKATGVITVKIVHEKTFLWNNGFKAFGNINLVWQGSNVIVHCKQAIYSSSKTFSPCDKIVFADCSNQDHSVPIRNCTWVTSFVHQRKFLAAWKQNSVVLVMNLMRQILKNAISSCNFFPFLPDYGHCASLIKNLYQP